MADLRSVHSSAKRAARRLTLTLTLTLAALCAFAFGPEAQAGPRHPAYIVVDAETGEVLRSSRSDLSRHPASLTKMMTLYLAFEALEARKLRPSQRLTASRHAASMPASEIGLRPGDQLTVREAIRASAIRSANDAAVVLAEAIGGSEPAFAQRMTRKAREMGMADTTFLNATGLTASGHVTTARDMAILARRLYLDYPDYYHLFSRTRVRVHGKTHRATNTLLNRGRGVDGIKTGYTRAAGYNLAASALRGERRVIVALLGGSSRPRRDAMVSRLLDDGFERVARHHSEGRLVVAARLPRPSLRPEAPRQTAPRSVTVAANARRGQDGALRGSVLDGWAVQVGAFLDLASARSQMQRIIELNPPGLISGFRNVATARVGGIGGRGHPLIIHRVRFTGLREEDARRACRSLESQRMDCALVPPIGWGSRIAELR